MDIVNPSAEKYIEQFSSPHDELLAELLELTNKHPHAHMVSGAVQGQLLKMISNMIRPLSILEIGTFTGYSALCLASGLQPNGHLHTIELRENDAATAKSFFNNSKYKHHITLHVGEALKVIPTLTLEWDLVFIDADKVNYIEYYELTLPQLKKGGFIVADNTLFHGQVLQENVGGKNAKAIHNFNKHIAEDIRTEQVLLSVRDGITIIRKIQ